MKKLNPSDFKSFLYRVSVVLSVNKKWRTGQAMFNVLYDMNPALVNSIRGTAADPFYSNEKIALFMFEILDEEAIKHCFDWQLSLKKS